MGNTGDDTMVIPPLVGDLVSAQFADYKKTTDQLITNLRTALADREAELAAIRMGIERLIYGDFMPTTNALARALNPSPEVIARHHKKEGAG